MPSKVLAEITYPFPNFNEVWEWIIKFIPHFMMDVSTYPCQVIKLNHVSEGDTGGRKNELTSTGNIAVWH